MAKFPIYYDIETTGIHVEKDRIIEIAAINPVTDKRFERLINPHIPIPEEATAIHGITDKMVHNAETFAEVGEAFIDFCSGDCVLIAHNNDHFDKLFLNHESRRHHLDLPNWDMVDSLKWARKYRSDLPRHSLQFLRQLFGIPENKAHRALDDVLVLYQVFSLMIDDLSIEVVIELLESTSDAMVEIMPFGKYKGKPLSKVPPDYIAWLNKQGAFDKSENKALKAAFEKLEVLQTISH